MPELIFGHLLTSSNYNDNEKKVGARVECQVAAHGRVAACCDIAAHSHHNPHSAPCVPPHRNPAPQVTGGRNGYGAKLANIFSKRFVVETLDSKRGRRYKQARRRGGGGGAFCGRQPGRAAGGQLQEGVQEAHRLLPPPRCSPRT